MFKKLFGGLRGASGDSQVTPAPHFEQRRKMARRSLSMEVELAHGRKGYMVTVEDLGAGGMLLRIESPGDFKPGAAVKVICPEESNRFEVRSVDGIVRWSRRRDSDDSQLIGVEYKDQKALARSWVKVKMQDLGFQSYNLREQRAHHRARCQFSGMLDVGGVSVRCFVTDIGLGGCRVVLLQPVRAGATVTLKAGQEVPHLEGLTLSGVVRHQQQLEPTDPFGYGCAFQGLSEEQQEAIKSFMTEQHELNWDRIEEWPEINFLAKAPEEVEIPSLSSILEDD